MPQINCVGITMRKSNVFVIAENPIASTGATAIDKTVRKRQGNWTICKIRTVSQTGVLKGVIMNAQKITVDPQNIPCRLNCTCLIFHASRNEHAVAAIRDNATQSNVPVAPEVMWT